MPEISVPVAFTARDYQQEMYDALDGEGFKRVLLRWHRRAGKDLACWCYLISEAVEKPGQYFYCYPTYQQGRKALWENSDGNGLRYIDQIPSVLIKSINHQEMKIELKKEVGGSIIRVIGTDQVDNDRGVSARGAVFSEFDFQNIVAYRTLMPAIREKGGWVIINSTPKGKGNLFEYEQIATANPDKWYTSVLQTLWPDQPNYSGLVKPEDIPLIQQEDGLTDDEMEAEYGVSYNAKIVGSIYGDLIHKAETEGRIGHFPYDDSRPVNTYWDLGRSDMCCIWFTQKVGNRIVVVDYHEENGKSIDHYGKVLYDKGYYYGYHHLPHDGGHKTMHHPLSLCEQLDEQCRQYKIGRVAPAAPRLKIADGINAVRRRFSRYYFDTEKCKTGIDRLKYYHYKMDEKRRVYLKEPVHDVNSHGADALRTEAITSDVHDTFEYGRPTETTPKVITDFNAWDD